MYIVQSRVSGFVIERCDTLEEAESVVEIYERKNMEEGNYSPNLYEIKEE